MEWISKALWSKIDQTKDSHISKGRAQSVANMLLEYDKDNPCPIRGVCLESWIEPNPPKE